MNIGIIGLIKEVSWPIAILVGSILLFTLVRRGKVQSISASREGGISLSLAPVDQREGSRHAMDRRIQAVDDELTLSAKRATKAMRRPIVQAVADITTCAVSKRALGSDLLEPLFDACDENDFKTHLAAKSRSGYIDEKMDAVREEYEDLRADATTGCASENEPTDIPAWESVEGRIREVIERWAAKVGVAVEAACRSKIEIYTECQPQFASAGDRYFASVVEECIAKNKRYIAGLEGKDAA